MPEFSLNKPRKSHPFYTLDSFARGYVEAMFFTNGDIGDEKREDRLNEMGVERLTRKSVEAIARDCTAFQANAGPLLAQAYARDYDESQAGRDFWFTRQGHGVGYWDRKELEPDTAEYEALTDSMVAASKENTPDRNAAWGKACTARSILKESSLGALLTKAAKGFGECNPEAWRGWIHYH